MKTTFKSYRVTIKKPSKSNRNFLRLYGIFRSTLNPEMTFKAFYDYYVSEKLDYIDVTFLYYNKVLAGFYSASFYKVTINGKKKALGRAATGILPEYQQKAMPKFGLFYKYVNYKYRHPFTGLIVSAFLANALVYAMICKYTAWVWPRINSTVPANIDTIKAEILNSSKTAEPANHPYVVKINFKVSIGESLLERIYSSQSCHVQYFLQINPHFYNQQCVLIIVPFTWLNLALSALLFLYYSCQKSVEAAAKNILNMWSEIFSFTGKGLEKN
ncbi:MAG TPA: hypothetical protein PLP23_06540 [Panacibacter sp.]|nr:hypothetical protein [Panacibacter sp.]